MTIAIDLNADLGEGDPFDAALLKVVTSCNIACGGHAGNAESMAATLGAAAANGVSAGAHPSYPDPQGHGRRSYYLLDDALSKSLEAQVSHLVDIATKLGIPVQHVKAHGALYNDACENRDLADRVAAAAMLVPGSAALVGQPDSEIEAAAARYDLRFVAEAFVDRAYQDSGRLVPRTQPGAVYSDPEAMARQAVMLAVDGRVRTESGTSIAVRADTLCLHGDTPGADRAAAVVRDALEQAGVVIHAVAP